MIRFAALTLAALVACGVGVLSVVSAVVHDQSAADARQFASSFARLAVKPNLSEADLRRGVDPASRRGLAEVLREAHRGGQFPRIKIWNRRHRVVYSDDLAENGRVLPTFPDLEAALAGREVARLGLDRNDRPSDSASGTPYQAYIPLRFAVGAAPAGVVEVHIPQDQLVAGLRDSERHITVAIVVCLVLLYALLLAIRAAGLRASRRHALERGRLAAIVDASDEVIIRKDLEGNVVSWNRGAEKVYGYRADEMVGRKLSVLAPPDRPDEMPGILARIERGERLEQYETKRVAKAGRVLDMSISVSPIRDSDNTIVGAAVVGRDITERKRAEEQLRKSEAQLAAAQQLATLGSWTREIATGEVSWSAEMFLIWGLDQATDEPNYRTFLDSIHPDDRETVERLGVAAVADRSGYDAEFRIVRPDGGVRIVSVGARVVVDEHGQPVRLIGSVLDVTEHKEIEAALRRSAEELEARVITDPLTGLLNHGGFHEAVENELARCRRYGGRFGLVLLDLDGFKPINDTYGHAEGDRVLREVAATLAATSRPSDVVGRVGGDEFAVLLPETSGADAASAGERLKQAVAELGAGVAISFGVGEWPADGPGKESVFFRADMALYAAKGSSRDGSRVEAAARLAETMAGATAGADQQSVRRILDTAREQLGMSVAYVSEFVGDDQVIRSLEGGDGPEGLEVGTEIELHGSYCKRVVTGELTGVVSDARNDPRVCTLPVTEEADIGSYVGVPIRFSDGSLYGTLCCASREANPALAERDAAFMRVLARLVGDHLEHVAHEARSRRMELEAESAAALLSALDARDAYTSEHSISVVTLAGLVARELELPEGDATAVEQAARLHDVGKLGVPDSILQKPGPLDDAEWAAMREHPTIGAGIVSSVAALAHLAPLVRAEHERWDGGGYPDGLAGEAIPLASRIILACDSYHAMTSDRPYRSAMPADEARRELELNSGSQFDPRVVDALLRVLSAQEPEQVPLDSRASTA